MKHFLRVLLFCVAALPACAFTPNTSTGVFSAVSRRPQPDFQWTWSAQNSQAINVEFQQAVGVTSVLFRLSSPERGPYYLQVNNGVITPGPTSVVWQTLLPINPSNVPPAQTLPYFAEFLGFGSNNVQKTLAAGRVAVAWSIFNGTNAASFQTANIVYTNVGSFVVSFPSQSIETNHLGTTTMALLGSETTARVGADSALSNRIAGTSNTLSAAVSAETAARVAADAALSNALTTVSNSAAALVSAETTARTNGDASVLAQLVASSNSLHAVDVSLSNQIAALSGGGTSVVQETAARIAADAALSNKINTVSNAFAAADADTWGKFTAASNSLSTRIDAETAARIAAVGGVSNALATTSNSLSTRIDAEVAARVAAVAGVSNSLSTATNAFAVSLTAASNTLNANLIAASNSLAAQITSVNTGLSASAAATSNSLSARIIAASNTLNANIVATSNSMVAQVAAALAKAVTNNGVVINGQALTNGMSLLVGGLATNATLLSLGGTNLPGPLALANSAGVTWLNTATGLAAAVTAAGTFTNLVWNGNANTAQAIVLGESNVVLRYTGGTSYVGLARSITGDLTFNGAINANDNIEIANTKHLRFQDGGGTNTVHLEAVKGRLIITGAVDIVSGQAVPVTINGSVIATGTPLYVHSETNAAARLASNVWAAADSTTNYVRRTGDTMSGPLLTDNSIGHAGAFRVLTNPFIGFQNDGFDSFSGMRIEPNSYISTVGKMTLGGFIGNPAIGAGAIQEFGYIIDLDGSGTSGDYWRLRYVFQNGNTQTLARLTADVSSEGSQRLVISNGIFHGTGGGITEINSGALTNLGNGLAVVAGNLTSTNGLAQVLANGVNAGGQNATNFGTVQAVVFAGNGASITNVSITNVATGAFSSGGLAIVGTNGRLTVSGGYTNSAYNMFVMLDINGNVIYTPFISTVTNTFTNRQIFTYTGNTNTFTVPAGITQLWIKCWGAGGGHANGGTGGHSAYVHNVTPAETLSIVVGQAGQTTSSTNSFGTNQIATAGWPNGGAASQSGPTPSTTGGGGGWSAVLRGTNLLQCAGAGGGGQQAGGIAGGVGGGLSGSTGSAGGAAGGTGGSQAAGGSNSGGYFFGGSAVVTTNSQVISGGGGGYYGGGAGRSTAGGGGGGSGFIPNIMYGVNVQGQNSADPDFQSGTGGAAQNGCIVIRW